METQKAGSMQDVLSGALGIGKFVFRKGVAWLKVEHIGPDLVSVEKNKAYDVISIEKGWYRIMTELDESYLFPPEVLRILNEDDESLFGGGRNRALCFI